MYNTDTRTVSPFEFEDEADLAVAQGTDPTPYWDPARLIEQNRENRDAQASKKPRHAGPRGRGHHNVAPRHAAPRHS